MSALVPCLACRRHIRSHEPVCCFCGVQNTAPEAVRQALPRGVGRATLFALSVTLAGQACADTNDVAIYGAPVPPGAGAADGAGGTRNVGGNGGTGAGASGGSNGNGSAGESNVQPVYGAVVPPQTGGSSGSAGLPEDNVEDAGSDAAGEDAG